MWAGFLEGGCPHVKDFLNKSLLKPSLIFRVIGILNADMPGDMVWSSQIPFCTSDKGVSVLIVEGTGANFASDFLAVLDTMALSVFLEKV